MELTKEHFDQSLRGVATKDDMQKAVGPLATSEQIEELARIVSSGFEDIQSRLDVTEPVKVFERKFLKLEEALHIKL
jgi:hypothetical protein